MRFILDILGGLFTLVGLIWLLQGLNVLPGSFMTGQSLYAVLGLVLAVIGVSTLVLVNRRPRLPGRMKQS